MGAVATFNYTAWVARYPEFSAVSQSTAQEYFNEACLYLDNTGCGLIPAASTQLTLLNMLTAHIAQLNFAQNGIPASPLVGRIANASEGSVSVQAENNYAPGTPQWYQQTRYGSAFWAATQVYRTMAPTIKRTRNMDAYSGGNGWPGWGGTG